MSDYAALNTNLIAKLASNAYMIANGVTVEKWTRGLEVQDDDGTLRFDDTDLPLLVVQVPAGGKSSEFHPQEIRSEIPGLVTTISTSAARATGIDPHLGLVSNLEIELEGLKTSAENLGANTLVHSVSSDVSSFKRGEAWYFITKTQFSIDATNNY